MTGSRTPRRWLTPVAGIAVLSLLAAACGDDDGDSADTTPAEEAEDAVDDAATSVAEAAEDAADTVESTVEEAMEDEDDASETTEAMTEDTEAEEGGEATGDPVTIAVLSDESGPSQTRSIEVLSATADAINAEGGLNGHPIELVHTDMTSDPATAQAAVADLPDDVVAVFLGSAATEATIAASLNEVGVPVLGIGYQPPVWGAAISMFQLECTDDSPDYCAQPNFMTAAPTIEQTIAQQLTGAVAAGATKVTTAYCAEVDSCSTAQPIFEAIGASLGLEVLPGVPISTTAPDYSAECIGFIQDGVDFVQISASAAAAVNLVASCQDQGYEGTFGASAGSVDSSILGTNAPFAGGLNGFPWWVDDPLVVEYREIMEGAGVPEEDWAYAVGSGQYANMRLLQKALADHADPDAPLDGAAALEAMFQVDGEDLGGLLAYPVSYSPDVLNRTVPCYWTYLKAADGTLENPLGGLATQCFPEQ